MSGGVDLGSLLRPALLRHLRTEASGVGAYAGAVLHVVHRGEVIVDEAVGHAEMFDRDGVRLERPRPMTVDAPFDLASLTKVVATTNVLASLVEAGRLSLLDPVHHHLAPFDRPGKRDVLVQDLLTHSAGLASWHPLYLFVDRPEDAIELIAELPGTFPRGSRRLYSDTNFIVLGALLEAVGQAPLDALFERGVARPLGLTRTSYRPPAEWRRACVATSLGNPLEERMWGERPLARVPPRRPADLPGWRRHVLVGEANDANCHLVFASVAGHAGLFATASDLALVGRSLLASLDGSGRGLHRADTALHFTTSKVTPGQGLGWWTQRLDASPRTFGHRGFTGTQLFVDPEQRLVIVLLTNRVHALPPYADPDEFTTSIVSSLYRGLGIAQGVVVDPGGRA